MHGGKIPNLAWSLLLALAPGLGAQEHSLAGVCEQFFPIGAAVDPDVLRGAGGLLARQFNSLTAENDMKWERLLFDPRHQPKKAFWAVSQW
jgi:GH35 family endo-1,4-beta-xylanase